MHTYTAPLTGLSPKDSRSFSISRAIGQLLVNGNSPDKLTGIEGEIHRAAKNHYKGDGREFEGIAIAQDVIADGHRDLSAGSSALGGNFIQTSVPQGSLIELLRAKMVCARLGAVSLNGLKHNVELPRLTGTAGASWLSETAQVSEVDPTLGQVALTPHRITARVAFSKQLFMQTGGQIEDLVRNDIAAAIAVVRDFAALNGPGTTGIPMGIISTPGVSTVTFSGQASYAKIVSFETTIANLNADIGSLGWATSPNTRSKWRQFAKVSGYPSFLWEDTDSGSQKVLSYRAEVTSNLNSSNANDICVFGNWSDLILADFAGMDVCVDPYSLKKSGEIEVVITQWVDNCLRHPASFCVSTDSAAQ